MLFAEGKRPAITIFRKRRSGLEAIRMAEELKPDLILLDIGPPNLNGIEAEKRVGPLVPRIGLSFWRTNGASWCKPLYAQRLTVALRCRPHPSDLNVGKHQVRLTV